MNLSHTAHVRLTLARPNAILFGSNPETRSKRASALRVFLFMNSRTSLAARRVRLMGIATGGPRLEVTRGPTNSPGFERENTERRNKGVLIFLFFFSVFGNWRCTLSSGGLCLCVSIFLSF
jgi:hypothetical protein